MRALVVDDSRAMRSPRSPVLRDWRTPRVDHLEFLIALRKQPRLRPLLVTMVTSEREHEQMVRALLAGADEARPARRPGRRRADGRA